MAAAAECWRIARGKSYRLVGGHAALQRLADQLNALDEQKEVPDGERTETAVFAITQSFNRAVPLEEQLRQLAALPVDQPGQPRGSLVELHLQQLIVEYALLKRNSRRRRRCAPATGEPSVSEAVK